MFELRLCYTSTVNTSRYSFQFKPLLSFFHVYLLLLVDVAKQRTQTVQIGRLIFVNDLMEWKMQKIAFKVHPLF